MDNLEIKQVILRFNHTRGRERARGNFEKTTADVRNRYYDGDFLVLFPMMNRTLCRCEIGVRNLIRTVHYSLEVSNRKNKN